MGGHYYDLGRHQCIRCADLCGRHPQECSQYCLSEYPHTPTPPNTNTHTHTVGPHATPCGSQGAQPTPGYTPTDPWVPPTQQVCGPSERGGGEGKEQEERRGRGGGREESERLKGGGGGRGGEGERLI